MKRHFYTAQDKVTARAPQIYTHTCTPKCDDGVSRKRNASFQHFWIANDYVWNVSNNSNASALREFNSLDSLFSLSLCVRLAPFHKVTFPWLFIVTVCTNCQCTWLCNTTTQHKHINEKKSQNESCWSVLRFVILFESFSPLSFSTFCQAIAKILQILSSMRYAIYPTTIAIRCRLVVCRCRWLIRWFDCKHLMNSVNSNRCRCHQTNPFQTYFVASVFLGHF